MNAPLPFRLCKACGAVIATDRRSDAATCSKACRQAAHRRRRAPRPPPDKHAFREMADALAVALDVLERLDDGRGVDDDDLAHAREVVTGALGIEHQVEHQDEPRVAPLPPAPAAQLDIEDKPKGARPRHPSPAAAQCRVEQCAVKATEGANHGFCPGHLARVPRVFTAKWERATLPGELERLWQQVADDFAFEDK